MNGGKKGGLNFEQFKIALYKKSLEYSLKYEILLK